MSPCFLTKDHFDEPRLYIASRVGRSPPQSDSLGWSSMLKNENVSVEFSRGETKLDIVRSLRYRVLRVPLNLPFETTLFEGDTLPTTQHLIAYQQNGDPIGCATILVTPPDSGREWGSGQLRGMAVLESLQHSGVGSTIMASAHAFADENRLKLWCKARLSAVPFYAKQGWEIDGDEFIIEGIGPHYIMRRSSFDR